MKGEKLYTRKTMMRASVSDRASTLCCPANINTSSSRRQLSLEKEAIAPHIF